MATAIEAAYITADGAAVTGKGTFYGVSVLAGSCTIYDNTSAAGTDIVAAVGLPGIILGGNGVPFQTALYVDLTTGPVVVYFTRHS